MALLQAYVNLSEGEVSGIGKVERLGSEDFLVTEILLIEQESGWAYTELNQEALARFLEELISKGEDPATYRLWWHSHANGDVFWSGTDETTCRRFGNQWMLAIVANKGGEILGRIDVYEPIHLASELPVRVYTPLEEGEEERIKEELKRKVRRKAWTFRRWGWGWDDGEGEEEESQDRGSSSETVGEEGPWTS
jgi:hypothetical protein